MNEKTLTVLCPVCKARTHTRIYPSTVMNSFPLFCPKCKRQTVIDAEHGIVTAVTDSNTNSR